MESLRWLVGLARRSGVLRIVVNGSFISDAFEPNDVDCVLLIDAEYPKEPAAETELQEGLPLIQATLATIGNHWQPMQSSTIYVQTLYGTDRRGVSKGPIEVLP